MANMNIVILAGRMTRDVQVSYLPSNAALGEFGLAINHKWKAANGETKEDVCFVDCKAFGKGAETLAKYVKKGDPLLIEGRLKFESWESKEGQKRSKHTVTVENFQFLGGKREESQQSETANQDEGDVPPWM